MDNLKTFQRDFLNAIYEKNGFEHYGYLSGHLTRTRMRKLDLLRRAAVLAHAES